MAPEMEDRSILIYTPVKTYSEEQRNSPDETRMLIRKERQLPCRQNEALSTSLQHGSQCSCQFLRDIYTTNHRLANLKPSFRRCLYHHPRTLRPQALPEGSSTSAPEGSPPSSLPCLLGWLGTERGRESSAQVHAGLRAGEGLRDF